MNGSYALDKPNAKLMGVCAGLAGYTGWNVLAIRLALIALTLFVLGPIALLAYVLIGWAAG